MTKSNQKWYMLRGSDAEGDQIRPHYRNRSHESDVGNPNPSCYSHYLSSSAPGAADTLVSGSGHHLSNVSC